MVWTASARYNLVFYFPLLLRNTSHQQVTKIDTPLDPKTTAWQKPLEVTRADLPDVVATSVAFIDEDDDDDVRGGLILLFIMIMIDDDDDDVRGIDHNVCLDDDMHIVYEVLF